MTIDWRNIAQIFFEILCPLAILGLGIYIIKLQSAQADANDADPDRQLEDPDSEETDDIES